MANGNRNEFMAGLRRSSTSSSIEWDVGLALKMQPIESSSYPCKRTTVMLPPPHQQAPSGGTSLNIGDGDEDGRSGGGPSFRNTSFQVSSLSDVYDVAGLGAAVSARAFLPRTWNPFTSLPDISTSLKTSGEGMPLFSKADFTASQRQELERQTMICKYMMASVPVPPELLLPLPKDQFPGPVSQSSTLEVRLSSGSDPEPWRCRRTDGKKWRCSRNVTPGQKYCERHAHKSRPRSRKPVEIQSQNTDVSYNYASKPNNFPINTISQPLAHLPSMWSVASCGQTRGVELFSKGGCGTIPFFACNQQWQHQMHSTTTMDLSRHNLELNKEECSFQVQQGDNLGIQKWESRHCKSQFDPKMAFLPGNLNAHTMQTRHFIDTWSTAEKRGQLGKVGKKECVTSSMKLPVSSLTLSMPGGNEIDEDHEQGDTSSGVIIGLESNSKECRKAQWMNPVTWMGTTPGGPLGEALCLGVASCAKGASSLPSAHGCSNSTTTTSSCSRSSCEDGSQAHNFIG